MSQSNNYENLKSLYDEPLDISSTFKAQIQQPTNMTKELNDRFKDRSPSNNSVELKTECDDMDIIVTDPAVCTTPKSFDGSREGKKDLSVPVDYQSPQDSK